MNYNSPRLGLLAKMSIVLVVFFSINRLVDFNVIFSEFLSEVAVMLSLIQDNSVFLFPRILSLLGLGSLSSLTLATLFASISVVTLAIYEPSLRRNLPI